MKNSLNFFFAWHSLKSPVDQLLNRIFLGETALAFELPDIYRTVKFNFDCISVTDSIEICQKFYWSETHFITFFYEVDVYRAFSAFAANYQLSKELTVILDLLFILFEETYLGEFMRGRKDS